MRNRKCLWTVFLFILVLLKFTDAVWSQTTEEYYNQGSESYRRSDYRGALDAWQKGFLLAKKTNNLKSVGTFLSLIGALYQELGDYPKAVFHYETALEILKIIGDRNGEGNCLSLMGDVYRNLNDNKKAISYYVQAVKINRKIGNREGEGDDLNNIGLVYSDLGDYPKALTYYEQSLKIRKEIGDREGEGRALGNIGVVYSKGGDYPKALSYFEQALKIFREIGDRKDEGKIFVSIGLVYSDLGDYPKALTYYEQSLKIHKEIGDREGEGLVLGNIGGVYRHLGDYPKALSYQKQALKIHKEIGDREGEGRALGNIGAVYINLSDYPKALLYLEQALKIDKEIGEPGGLGATLINIGIVYSNLGDYPTALTYYEQSLKIHKEIGDRDGEGASLSLIGSFYGELGDYPQVLSYLEQSLKIRKEIGDREGEGSVLNDIGLVYSDLGDYSKALSCYSHSLKIHKEIGDRDGVGDNLGNIGLVYSDLGDYPKALSYHEQALKIKKEIGDRKGEGSALNNIGYLYMDLGDYPKALSYYWKALRIFQNISVPEATQAESNIGDTYLEQGRLQEALRVFMKLDKHISLGKYYLCVGDYKQARREFSRNLNRYEEVRNAQILIAKYIGLGLSYEGLASYYEAIEYYHKAIDLIEKQRERLTEPQRRNFFGAKVMGFSRLEPYEGLVRVSHYLKDEREGFYWAENTRARLLLEALARSSSRDRLGIPEKFSVKETELTNRVAALHKQMEIAFKKTPERYGELEQELAVLKKDQEAFIAKLRREYPGYAAIRYPQPIRLREVKLMPGEVLIEYEVTDKETFAWLIKQGKVIKSITIPLTREKLTTLVKRYRAFFEGKTEYRQLSHFDARVGKELYDLLFKDLAAHIKQGESLIIIPDEILGILPFETLVADLTTQIEMASGKYGPYPQGVSYMGDLYPISYYQSATALTLARTLKKKETLKKNMMLVVADPVFDVADARLKGKKVVVAHRDEYQMRLMRVVGEDWQGVKGEEAFLPRLETTGHLADNLRRSYGKGVDVLRGIEASEDELRKRSLDQYRYQVFATHGILDNEVPYIQEPALVLSQVGTDPQDRKKDGFLTMTEVMDLKLNADVVALTACNTGIGKNLTGEGVMGMGRAFQYAGAKSVLMSLWSVEDESTNLLTEKFFTYLKQGKDKLAALRLSRADVRKAGYEHPFFWAPFILVGAKKIDHMEDVQTIEKSSPSSASLFQDEFSSLLKHASNKFKNMKGDYLSTNERGYEKYGIQAFSLSGSTESDLWKRPNDSWYFVCKLAEGASATESLFDKKVFEIKEILPSNWVTRINESDGKTLKEFVAEKDNIKFILKLRHSLIWFYIGIE